MWRRVVGRFPTVWSIISASASKFKRSKNHQNVGNNLPTTYQPFTNNLSTTYQPFTNHLSTTYQPLINHLPTTQYHVPKFWLQSSNTLLSQFLICLAGYLLQTKACVYRLVNQWPVIWQPRYTDVNRRQASSQT